LAARKLEVIVPARLWDKMDVLERETGIRKQDMLMKAIVNIIEGVRCPKCGTVFKEFG